MENPQVGWIAAIIIGGIAGWLAERFMQSNMGVLMKYSARGNWRCNRELAFRNARPEAWWLGRLWRSRFRPGLYLNLRSACDPRFIKERRVA